MNARNREMTGVSDYVCTSTFCVRRSTLRSGCVLVSTLILVS